MPLNHITLNEKLCMAVSKRENMGIVDVHGNIHTDVLKDDVMAFMTHPSNASVVEKVTIEELLLLISSNGLVIPQVVEYICKKYRSISKSTLSNFITESNKITKNSILNLTSSLCTTGVLNDLFNLSKEDFRRAFIYRCSFDIGTLSDADIVAIKAEINSGKFSTSVLEEIAKTEEPFRKLLDITTKLTSKELEVCEKELISIEEKIQKLIEDNKQVTVDRIVEAREIISQSRKQIIAENKKNITRILTTLRDAGIKEEDFHDYNELLNTIMGKNGKTTPTLQAKEAAEDAAARLLITMDSKCRERIHAHWERCGSYYTHSTDFNKQNENKILDENKILSEIFEKRGMLRIKAVFDGLLQRKNELENKIKEYRKPIETLNNLRRSLDFLSEEKDAYAQREADAAEQVRLKEEEKERKNKARKQPPTKISLIDYLDKAKKAESEKLKRDFKKKEAEKKDAKDMKFKTLIQNITERRSEEAAAIAIAKLKNPHKYGLSDAIINLLKIIANLAFYPFRWLIDKIIKFFSVNKTSLSFNMWE